jgi:hypothetical protein
MFRLSMIALIMALSCEVGFAKEDRSSANFAMKGCRLFAGDQPLAASFNDGHCVGLIEGLVYAHPMICTPPGVTKQQAVRVVVQYIDQQPARLHESFIDLALEALRRAWPCKR